MTEKPLCSSCGASLDGGRCGNELCSNYGSAGGTQSSLAPSPPVKDVVRAVRPAPNKWLVVVMILLGLTCAGVTGVRGWHLHDLSRHARYVQERKEFLYKRRHMVELNRVLEERHGLVAIPAYQRVGDSEMAFYRRKLAAAEEDIAAWNRYQLPLFVFGCVVLAGGSFLVICLERAGRRVSAREKYLPSEIELPPPD